VNFANRKLNFFNFFELIYCQSYMRHYQQRLVSDLMQDVHIAELSQSDYDLVLVRLTKTYSGSEPP